MKEDQRKLKGEETKKRILDASMLIIAEGGFKALSANKIAEKANISKSSIFHHFSSIEAIPYELIANLCAVMTNTAAYKNVTDTRSFFKAIGESTFSLNGEELIYYKTLFSFYNEAIYTGKYNTQMNQLKQDFMIFIQESIEQFDGVKIPTELAELITIDLDGLGLHYLIEEDCEKFIELWRLKTQVYIQHIKMMK